METKKKNPLLKGCLIAVAIGASLMFIVLIIAVIFADKSPDKVVDKTPSEVAVDSTIIKHNDSLRLEAKKKIETEKAHFITNYDDIEKVTWIYSKTKPKYANTMALYNYIGLKDDGKAWRRFVIRYHGDDWLFINSIIIKTDNQTYTLDASDSKRDNDTDVWEWIDIPEGNPEFAIINDIINSKNVKVRFVGRQYHKDWTLSSKEIKGLKEIEDYYYLLNSYNALNQ